MHATTAPNMAKSLLSMKSKPPSWIALILGPNALFTDGRRHQSSLLFSGGSDAVKSEEQQASAAVFRFHRATSTLG
jgi:hypothetical protein